MLGLPVPVLPNPTVPMVRPRTTRARTAVVASADASFRERLSGILTGLRWQVRTAASGSEAWPETEGPLPEALIVDAWLPDLEVAEFVKDFHACFPAVDLVNADGTAQAQGPRGAHRQELLYALRSCQDHDTAVWHAAPALDRRPAEVEIIRPGTQILNIRAIERGIEPDREATAFSSTALTAQPKIAPGSDRLPELVGTAPCMLEVSRRVRLVAPRATPVLIEGPTGSGKELVAQALHRLSTRNRKSFVAINCAAIPEALLEAELFGHTRGAFTGAVQGRVGRIEAADGGTLFLDEIGEMPLALQSKLLRFVESGELQRVGDNETVKVDVRIVAATHRPLVQHTQQGSFRADLYYRLAVFLIRTPALTTHLEDLPQLVEHFLDKMGRTAPVKQIAPAAMARLAAHNWPGNVRELEHVLERAAILAGEASVLTVQEIDFGVTVN
jgi:DNA-binding NtrC family response regulator